jgi:hypothetical protein
MFEESFGPIEEEGEVNQADGKKDECADYWISPDRFAELILAFTIVDKPYGAQEVTIKQAYKGIAFGPVNDAEFLTVKRPQTHLKKESNPQNNCNKRYVKGGIQLVVKFYQIDEINLEKH